MGDVEDKIFIRFGDVGYVDIFSLAKIISDSATPRRILHGSTE